MPAVGFPRPGHPSPGTGSPLPRSRFRCSGLRRSAAPRSSRRPPGAATPGSVSRPFAFRCTEGRLQASRPCVLATGDGGGGGAPHLARPWPCSTGDLGQPRAEHTGLASALAAPARLPPVPLSSPQAKLAVSPPTPALRPTPLDKAVEM